MKSSKYSILIICEGENTEPLFFNSIRDRIQKHIFDVDAIIKILPEPKVDYKTKDSISLNPHKKQRRKRELKSAIKQEPEILDGKPPLRWVKTGHRELEDGTYDEVWVVFDRDNHPARKEAFDEAKKNINGKTVKIAYSSRSFEYYLLLHFERLFRSFEKTECKVDVTPIGCGTNTHEKDCMGGKCINGYARKNRYWEETKNRESIFKLIEDKLVFGFENSAWIRYISNIVEKDVPEYDRNPYVTVDRLVKRLTGHEDFEWEYIHNTGKLGGLNLQIDSNNNLKIKNKSNGTLIIQSNSIYRTHITTRLRTSFGDRKVLYPNDEYTIEIEKGNEPALDVYFGFTHKNKTILFDFANNNSVNNLASTLVKLSHKELSELLLKLREQL